MADDDAGASTSSSSAHPHESMLDSLIHPSGGTGPKDQAAREKQAKIAIVLTLIGILIALYLYERNKSSTSSTTGTSTTSTGQPGVVTGGGDGGTIGIQGLTGPAGKAGKSANTSKLAADIRALLARIKALQKKEAGKPKSKTTTPPKTKKPNTPKGTQKGGGTKPPNPKSKAKTSATTSHTAAPAIARNYGPHQGSTAPVGAGQRSRPLKPQR